MLVYVWADQVSPVERKIVRLTNGAHHTSQSVILLHLSAFISYLGFSIESLKARVRSGKHGMSYSLAACVAAYMLIHSTDKSRVEFPTGNKRKCSSGCQTGCT